MVALLLALALVGCPRDERPPPLTAGATPESEALRLAGDPTATPLLDHLVQVFESRLPGAPLVVEPPLGAAGAYAAMADGRLAGVIETVPLGAPPAGQRIARSAVVLVVGPGVRDRRLEAAELIALARGEPGRWPGGLPRQLALRPLHDPLQHALIEGMPALGEPLLDAVRARQWPVHTREATLREAVRRPGVVGIADRGNLRLHGSPTFEVTLPGRRPAAVEIRLVPAEPVPPRLRAFLAFATGEEGRALVIDLGFEAPAEPAR